MNDNFHLRDGKVEFRWKRWRNKKRQEVSSCLMVLFSGAVILGAGGIALAGPTGGQVTGGQGTITTPDGTTTNINQQSNVLNINWQDFSIQQGETVNFYQPGPCPICRRSYSSAKLIATSSPAKDPSPPKPARACANSSAGACGCCLARGSA